MEIRMLEIRSDRGITRPVLIRDAGAALLADTGYPLTAEAVLSAMRDAGCGPEALTVIALTHQDIDHVGCAKDILARCPGAMALCHEAEAPYIRGDRTPVKYESLPEGHEFRLAYARRVLPSVRTVKDGERIQFPSEVVAVHTPGHTPGHMCLYVSSMRALIAGDALNIDGGALTGPNPVYTKDMQEAYRSLEKLLPLAIDRVYTYHGGVFEGDVAGALGRLIAAGPGR